MDSILGIKTSHDGSIALLDRGRLMFSIENEKDSNERLSCLSASTQLRVFKALDHRPAIIALSGWAGAEGGYFGCEPGSANRERFFGDYSQIFSSSHERSHVMCAYGLSPYEQGRPCYALIWEGTIGRFYHIDKNCEIAPYPTVLAYPGQRYIHAYYLGSAETKPADAMAGKMMALAAFNNKQDLSESEKNLLASLMSPEIDERHKHTNIHRLFPQKGHLKKIPWIDGGLETNEFRSFAKHLSDAIFETFFSFARTHLRDKLPLLIAGGCGLNCEWNTRWKNCGLFEDVFIPPCTNDSGSAIGTAIDAQFYFHHNAKVEWSPYAGEQFLLDPEIPAGWREEPKDLTKIAAALDQGTIIPWVNGCYEMGPRALGNRSILASPFLAETKARLNRLKQRENFRPIAPVCLSEDVNRHFRWQAASPYMLHFQEVLDASLKAVTHDDGSARVQTVSATQNLPLWELLSAFKARSGTGVLCNTSLNLRGRGFINRRSHLLKYCDANSLRVAIVNDSMFIKQH